MATVLNTTQYMEHYNAATIVVNLSYNSASSSEHSEESLHSYELSLWYAPLLNLGRCCIKYGPHSRAENAYHESLVD
jgi:hypothetical protein